MAGQQKHFCPFLPPPPLHGVLLLSSGHTFTASLGSLFVLLGEDYRVEPMESGQGAGFILDSLVQQIFTECCPCVVTVCCVCLWGCLLKCVRARVLAFPRVARLGLLGQRV